MDSDTSLGWCIIWRCTIKHGRAPKATYQGCISSRSNAVKLKEVRSHWADARALCGILCGSVGNQQIEALEFKAAVEWKQLTSGDSPLSWGGEYLLCVLCQDFWADYRFFPDWGAEDVVSCVKGFFQLGCRLEQRCFLFLIIHTSGS